MHEPLYLGPPIPAPPPGEKGAHDHGPLGPPIPAPPPESSGIPSAAFLALLSSLGPVRAARVLLQIGKLALPLTIAEYFQFEGYKHNFPVLERIINGAKQEVLGITPKHEPEGLVSPSGLFESILDIQAPTAALKALPRLKIAADSIADVLAIAGGLARLAANEVAYQTQILDRPPPQPSGRKGTVADLSRFSDEALKKVEEKLANRAYFTLDHLTLLAAIRTEQDKREAIRNRVLDADAQENKPFNPKPWVGDP